MSLNRTEVEAALQKLSPADIKRIKFMSQKYAHGLASMAAQDLMQEAYVKLLSEDRNFPCNTRTSTVVINAMHSIASNCRKREIEGAIDHLPQTSTTTQTSATEEGEVTALVVEVETTTPETILGYAQQLSEIEALIADDSELQDVATVWALGIRGRAAAEYLEWDFQKYEASRVRLVRRLKAYFKE